MKQVFAHGNHEDTGITAQLQIDPSEKIVAGTESKFFFVFQDSEGLFEVNRCDCEIVLLKDDVEQDRQLVMTETNSFASFGSYPLYSKTISEPGNYVLHLEGAPKDGAIFKPFELHFDVQVVKPQEQDNSIVYIGSVVIAILALVYFFKKIANKKLNNNRNVRNVHLYFC